MVQGADGRCGRLVAGAGRADLAEVLRGFERGLQAEGEQLREAGTAGVHLLVPRGGAGQGVVTARTRSTQQRLLALGEAHVAA